MLLASDLSRLAAQALALAAALVVLSAAPASAAISGAKGRGPLSPALEELAQPAVAAKTRAAQARHLGLPATGPGSLVRDHGRLLVTARLSDDATPAFPGLRRAGAQIISA